MRLRPEWHGTQVPVPHVYHFSDLLFFVVPFVGGWQQVYSPRPSLTQFGHSGPMLQPKAIQVDNAGEPTTASGARCQTPDRSYSLYQWDLLNIAA